MNRCMTYICDVCRDKLSSKENRDNVYCRVYSLRFSFMCVECSKIFSMAFEVTRREQPKYACESCEKVFQTLSGLRYHSYEHSNKWPYHCEECGNGFAIQSLLMTHIKAQHSEERPYKCNFCPSTFKLKQLLTSHLLMHDEQNPFTCEICNKRCQCQSALDTHMLKHTGLKRFKCDICSSAYKHKQNLVHHMAKFQHETGREQPSYACKDCEKVFETQTCLRYHSYEHSNDWPYHCEKCGKGYAKESLLITHIKAKHSEERPYKCKFCPSTFTLELCLTRHLLLHDEKNPFTCEICNKRCQCQAALDTHILKYSDLKRFKCDICSFAYKHKYQLVHHMDKFHHKSPSKC